MRAPEHQIAMLWVEGPLSYMEQLCAKSFLDAGHHVKLYHYGPVENVPEGVELADGNAVLSREDFIQHRRTGSFALFSDVFRYHLLKKNDRTIWADMDAYCLRPFETRTGHFYGWESPHHINGGVLGLPPESEALERLLQMTEDEFGIPDWFPEKTKAEMAQAKAAGEPVHVSDMPWGVWGPHAITHHLHVTGEDRHALPTSGLYPVPFRDRRKMARGSKRAQVDAMLKPESYSIHFYGRRLKQLLASLGGTPEPGSLIEHLLAKHRIEPEAAPVPMPEPREAPEAPPVPPIQPSTSPLPHLTDIAKRHGSDKGADKHRYTELYQLLFQPYRHQLINLLEMGLLIGGPEHGHDADRDTRDLPSIRMWLDFFTQAQIHGLDVSDFSWFEHERFTFRRCDMDSRQQLAEAAAALPVFDIIIDDASHASHHQQNAFLELFPRLRPGGIYIIEDLRWQPQTYERPGITKTAALFQSYLQDRVFSHSDPQVAEEFNMLRGEISGCFLHQVLFQKSRKDQVAVIHKR